jgi:hypothetical protein
MPHMTAVLVRLTGICIVLCVVLNTGMMVLGSSQPPQPVLAGFSEGCHDMPQPCWYGIVPGVTREPELLQLMAFAGDGRYSYDDQGTSYLIYFTMPPSVPACMLIFRLNGGLVNSATVGLCNRSPLRLGDLSTSTVPFYDAISMTPYQVAYGTVTLYLNGWPSPNSPVNSINLLSQADLIQHYNWHGFVPQWRYCQIEPEYPSCPP